jgi:hypothetical protein
VGLWDKTINTLNAELNPICHLLELLGAHHIHHVSRIRVKLLYFEDGGNMNIRSDDKYVPSDT